MFKQLFVVLLLSAVIVFGVRNELQQFTQTRLALAGPYEEIAPGTSLSRLCTRWQQQGLLTEFQCLQLKVLSVFKPELRQLKAGVYAVKPDLLFQQLALFRSGKVAQFSFMLREGETVAQSLRQLSTLPYLTNDIQDIAALEQLIKWPDAWGQPPSNVEALFFPETYYYTAYSKASQLYLRAHQALVKQLDTAWQQRDPTLPLQTPYELLTLASIIEKETGHLPEKPLIASVFVNRLQQKMKLQTDPTVIYGLGDQFQGDITRAHLRDPHPYNTYVHAGLPPGPIAMVSATSLQAAARPVSSDKLFFVARGDGTHQFSVTYQQHKDAIQQYIFGNKP